MLKCRYCGYREERPGILDKDHEEPCERCPDGVLRMVGLYRRDRVDD